MRQLRASGCLLIMIISCVLSLTLKAQNARITSPDGGMDAYRKVRKETYGTARIAVYYDLKFLKDSTKTTNYTKAKTVLQISDKYTKYGDYYQIVLDSLDNFFNECPQVAN